MKGRHSTRKTLFNAYRKLTKMDKNIKNKLKVAKDQIDASIICDQWKIDYMTAN